MTSERATADTALQTQAKGQWQRKGARRLPGDREAGGRIKFATENPQREYSVSGKEELILRHISFQEEHTDLYTLQGHDAGNSHL